MLSVLHSADQSSDLLSPECINIHDLVLLLCNDRRVRLINQEPLQEAWESGKEGDAEAGDELQEAQNSVTTSEKAGKWSKQNNLWQTLLQVSY